MKVQLDGGSVMDLGTTEDAPTISFVDYSRRTTDAFGVTTVVERDFARRLSVRFAVASGGVDALQRQLAALRATTALWIVDERYAWLKARGFYKDFSVDLPTATLSYCTLTVEGLAAAEPFTDAGGDPAPLGSTSTLRLLPPVIVTDAVLVSSTVAENDYPAWAAGGSYAPGARVIRTHRIWESLVAANQAEPSAAATSWLDLGPTNRWAMFDQALGTTTIAAGSIEVVLSAGAATAVALLDAAGATVRVRVGLYDRTLAIGAGAVTFLDLPGVTGDVTVTITGPGQVSVGTLLIGRVVGLGVTEASPSASITDYSRKEVDDFGEVTVVQRAWAKRMTARALIRTASIDLAAGRIAAVRARPALWIGQSGLDSLTVYGFFKDFSIEAGPSVSKLSLSIEGLSTAAPAPRTPLILSDRGVYSPTAVYREGDLVLSVGSSWRYIGTDPSAGNAPPVLPIEESAYWRLLARAGSTGGKGEKGDRGDAAPLVRVQWSVDGLTGWHDAYANGDAYQRQSNDNGATWGPAVRVVGEGAAAGAEGVSPQIVFIRSAVVPGTPGTGTGNPPPGWSDGPPAGADFLWMTKADFRGGAQLEPWSTPQRISGPAGETGASAFTLLDTQACADPGPTFVIKRAGGNAWNGKARTREGAATASVGGLLRPGTFIGLTADPNDVTDPVFASIDYALHWSINTRLYIYRNGDQVEDIGGRDFVEGPIAALIRSNSATVSYALGGTPLPQTTPVGQPEEPLYGSFAIYEQGSRIEGITFSVDGKQGTKGRDAVGAELTTPTFAVSADAGGVVHSYAGAEGVFRIRDGIADVTDTAGAWSGISVVDNPQAISIETDGRSYRATGGLDSYEPTASVTLRVSGLPGGPYAGVQIDKAFGLTKVKDGAAGSVGGSVARSGTVDQVLTVALGAGQAVNVHVEHAVRLYRGADGTVQLAIDVSPAGANAWAEIAAISTTGTYNQSLSLTRDASWTNPGDFGSFDLRVRSDVSGAGVTRNRFTVII